jgi:RimJ/RimL family protein N-acetyltransferase
VNVEPILTPRLILIPATIELLRLELLGAPELGRALAAEAPPDWPPGEYDRDAILFFLDKLTAGGSEAVGWYGWYAIRPASETEPAALVGGCGFLGPPDQAGMAEIGYSVSEHWRGLGFATEMVMGLVARALADSRVRRLTARTRADNRPSIIVLDRNGFRATPGEEEGMLLFEYASAAHSS